MINIFGPSYIKHTITVGGSVLGAFCAKTAIENNAKITGENALISQKLRQAHELKVLEDQHLVKVTELLIEREKAQQPQVVINKTSLFSASEENYWDFLGNSLTNSLDFFVELTVGPGNEIYLIFYFWLFTLFSLLNLKLLQNLFQKEGVFVENPRLASLFIIADKTALFFFLYASMILLLVFYTDCIVLENLKTVGLINVTESRILESLAMKGNLIEILNESQNVARENLITQCQTQFDEIKQQLVALELENKELSKQIEELSRKK